MKNRATSERHNTRTGLWGLVLSAWLLGFIASPAMAVSITDTYTDLVAASLGTSGLIPGPVAGLGGSLGFPSVTTLRNLFWSPALGTEFIAETLGTKAHSATTLALNSWARIFAQGQVGDLTKYSATHWAAAFSNMAPVTFSVPRDDHALLLIDGKLELDDGGVKAIGAPVPTAFALGTNHSLDLVFADGHVRQSGPSTASLLLFGATLVGLGAVVRRRMRGAAKPSV